jgi:hypothetical protein
LYFDYWKRQKWRAIHLIFKDIETKGKSKIDVLCPSKGGLVSLSPYPLKSHIKEH